MGYYVSVTVLQSSFHGLLAIAFYRTIVFWGSSSCSANRMERFIYLYSSSTNTIFCSTFSLNNGSAQHNDLSVGYEQSAIYLRGALL